MYNFELSKPQPRALRVDLVSFVPGPAAGQGESEPLPGLKEEAPLESVDPDKVPLDSTRKAIADPVKATPEPVATLKPEVSLKTKPKNLKELMAAKEKKEIPPPLKPAQRLKPKPKVDPKEALKKAREKLAKKIENQNQKQISEALSRMQTSIDAKGNNTNRSQEIGPGTGTGTGLGKQGYSPLDLYKMLLKSAIEQNWVFNDMLARMDQRLEVRVMIKILKTGEIRDVAYETKSGNRYLDESAKKAIKRANPLPQLPKGMNSYDVVVIFTPKGLK
ncbi:MAG: TonB family protein [Desulfobacteraceae bacterium]|nr:TonB family protein [Desulfobacteraceae bacterium]